MSYFCFEKEKSNKPVATIEGGKNHGKVIYLGEEEEKEEKCCEKCIKGCGIEMKKCCEKCKNCLNDEIVGGTEFDRLFGKEIKKIENGHFPYITIKDGYMVPIPRIKKEREEKRENIFVSGPEESGKSTWASNYIRKYKKIYPKSKFYIFSGVSKDAPLDELNPIRVKLDSKLVENPISIEEFPYDSIVLFDDIDTLEDREVRREVLKLRDRLLEKGRHKGIYVISITHNPTSGMDTKMSLLESSSVVLFPKGGDIYHMENVLKKYMGYNKKNINSIINLNTRWIHCHKRYPKYIIHEKGCFFP